MDPVPPVQAAPSEGDDLTVGPRNLTKCSVRLACEDGRSVVLKTVRGRPWLCRVGPARWLLRREARVLRHLAERGLAPTLVRDEGDTLVMERVHGQTLSDLRREGFAPDVAAAAFAELDRLHAAGYAHGDLGRRDIFVGPDGAARLIDFATCVGPGLPPVVGRWLAPLVRRRDRVRLRKILGRAVWRWKSEQSADA